MADNLSQVIYCEEIDTMSLQKQTDDNVASGTSSVSDLNETFITAFSKIRLGNDTPMKNPTVITECNLDVTYTHQEEPYKTSVANGTCDESDLNKTIIEEVKPNKSLVTDQLSVTVDTEYKLDETITLQEEPYKNSVANGTSNESDLNKTVCGEVNPNKKSLVTDQLSGTVKESNFNETITLQQDVDADPITNGTCCQSQLDKTTVNEIEDKLNKDSLLKDQLNGTVVTECNLDGTITLQEDPYKNGVANGTYDESNLDRTFSEEIKPNNESLVTDQLSGTVVMESNSIEPITYQHDAVADPITNGTYCQSHLEKTTAKEIEVKLNKVQLNGIVGTEFNFHETIALQEEPYKNGVANGTCEESNLDKTFSEEIKPNDESLVTDQLSGTVVMESNSNEPITFQHDVVADQITNGTYCQSQLEKTNANEIEVELNKGQLNGTVVTESNFNETIESLQEERYKNSVTNGTCYESNLDKTFSEEIKPNNESLVTDQLNGTASMESNVNETITQQDVDADPIANGTYCESQLEKSSANETEEVKLYKQMIASLELQIQEKDGNIMKMQADSYKQTTYFETKKKKLEEKLKIMENRETEFQEAIKTAEEQKTKALNELHDRIQKDQKMKEILEKYDRLTETHATEYANLKIQHKTVEGHLANLETAFGDLLQKYEKAKVVIEGFRSNEQVYKKNIQIMEENVEIYRERYETLKTHAYEQIDNANEVNTSLRSEREALEKKQNAIVKRQEIKIAGLENLLEQKLKECSELAALCDEVTGKKV